MVPPVSEFGYNGSGRGFLTRVMPSLTAQITSLAGPNGGESFLNCGIESGGWTPPPVKLDDLVMVNLSEALQDPDSPFKNCEPYLPLFNQYGDQTGSKS